jgi:predicted phosphoribosyltransferase
VKLNAFKGARLNESQWGDRKIMGMPMFFANRAEAGQRLAEALSQYKKDDVVVLAIPRGGVPVGAEISKALNAPLDIVLVRKIGAPMQPELAIAAVVDGAHAQTVRNEELLAALGISDEFMKQESARQLAEIERRRTLYLGDRARPSIAGKTVIVVDDGIATGATVRAALKGIRLNGPKRLILAVPVAPPDTIDALRDEVDAIVCLSAPQAFLAIGQFYADFKQLTDAEVIDLLGSAAAVLEASTATRT